MGTEAAVLGEARFDLTFTLTSSVSTACAGGSKYPSENVRKNSIVMRIVMNFYNNTQKKSKLRVK